MTSAEAVRAASDVRVIAYYRLPGANPTAARGENLSEWAAVRQTRPRFAGHHQPHLPGEFGYCDVRDPVVRAAHAALAREHAISGFCYVFRWSAGGDLDPTLAGIIADDRIDFPFCLCWETVESHGGAGLGAYVSNEARRYSAEECLTVMRSLLPALGSSRYLRVRGRPLFVVSSPDPIVDVRSVAAGWRDVCLRSGAGEPFLACYGGAIGAAPDRIGFDATIETPPLGGFPEGWAREIAQVTAGFNGDARNYRSYVAQMLGAARPEHTMFRCVMPGWDTTAREGDAAQIFVNNNPETFGFWTQRVADVTRLRFRPDERLMFVRSWNEWDAGCHLEPDQRHGRAYLQALATAVTRPPERAPERPTLGAIRAWARGEGLAACRVVRSASRQPRSTSGLRISVVMPAYNHARYVAAALDSVCAQSHANLEIIVVDDGSSDATPDVLDDYAARCTTHPITVVHQVNAGAHEALNHGLALARGEVVALVNSDDLYAPERLERMLVQMDERGAGLGFSATRFIDDEGGEVDTAHPYVKQLVKGMGEAGKAVDPLYVLIYCNIAVSTGNFVFRRQVLESAGGFCAMQVCHDWDFLLAASFVAPLTMVQAPLYYYRLHGANTFARSRIQAALELEQLLSGFFARAREHPLLQDPQRAAHFFAHVREVGLAAYLT